MPSEVTWGLPFHMHWLIIYGALGMRMVPQSWNRILALTGSEIEEIKIGRKDTRKAIIFY